MAPPFARFFAHREITFSPFSLRNKLLWTEAVGRKATSIKVHCGRRISKLRCRRGLYSLCLVAEYLSSSARASYSLAGLPCQVNLLCVSVPANPPHSQRPHSKKGMQDQYFRIWTPCMLYDVCCCQLWKHWEKKQCNLVPPVKCTGCYNKDDKTRREKKRRKTRIGFYSGWWPVIYSFNYNLDNDEVCRSGGWRRCWKSRIFLLKCYKPYLYWKAAIYCIVGRSVHDCHTTVMW